MVRNVLDISEDRVEEYGKFKTGAEKESGLFEEKGEGSTDMPGRRVEEILTFFSCGSKRALNSG